MAKGDIPDYHVHAMDKAYESFKARVGAAWINDDGSINITLSPFVKLEASPSLTIRLFPNNPSRPPATKVVRTNESDDDIPF